MLYIFIQQRPPHSVPSLHGTTTEVLTLEEWSLEPRPLLHALLARTSQPRVGPILNNEERIEKKSAIRDGIEDMEDQVFNHHYQYEYANGS